MRVSITLLQYEHGVIRQVVDCLKEIVEKDLLDKHEGIAMQIHSFLDEYMDRFHHQKEERFLFPTMRDLGDEYRLLIDDLKEDHERARSLISDLSGSIHEGRVMDRETFLGKGYALVNHITDHIKKEEDSAFPKLEEMISVDQDGELSARYEEFTLSEFDDTFMRRSEDLAFEIENKVLGPGYYEGVV